MSLEGFSLMLFNKPTISRGFSKGNRMRGQQIVAKNDPNTNERKKGLFTLMVSLLRIYFPN